MKRTFEITNRYGLKIVGDILFPENPVGVGVVLHGLGGFRQGKGIETLAQVLFDNNYIVVNFDATNSTGDSEGEYEDATLGKHYEDLVDVISWAEKQRWFIPQIMLAGHSMGAFAVTKYSEVYPEKVKGLFSFAPVISGKLSIEAREEFKPDELKNWKETGWFTRTSKSKPGLVLDLPYSHIEERLNHDLLIGASQITIPVAILGGENDTSCPPKHLQMLFDAISSENKELYIIQNAGHTFRTEEHLNQLKTVFDSWLKKLII